LGKVAATAGSVVGFRFSRGSKHRRTSRRHLEALRRDLKTAEDNATTFMPRYIALFKAERDKVENYALALHIGKNIVGGLLDGVAQYGRIMR
jgi:hypothetical protein